MGLNLSDPEILERTLLLLSDEQFSDWLHASDYDRTFAEYRAKVIGDAPLASTDAVVHAWEKESWEDLQKGGSGIPKDLKDLQAMLNSANTKGQVTGG